MLNRLPDDPAPAAETGGRSEKSKLREAGLVQRVTLGEMKYLKRQISLCWSPPVANTGAENLAVKVKLNLLRDGSLAAAPIVLNTGPTGFRVAAEAAVRAVKECAPFDMPEEKFEAWAEVIVNFDPRINLSDQYAIQVPGDPAVRATVTDRSTPQMSPDGARLNAKIVPVPA